MLSDPHLACLLLGTKAISLCHFSNPASAETVSWAVIQRYPGGEGRLKTLLSSWRIMQFLSFKFLVFCQRKRFKYIPEFFLWVFVHRSLGLICISEHCNIINKSNPTPPFKDRKTEINPRWVSCTWSNGKLKEKGHMGMNDSVGLHRWEGYKGVKW